jgi:hypothetical protein
MATFSESANSQGLRAELKRVTALEEFARGHLDELDKKIRTVELQQGELQLQTNQLESRVLETSKKEQQAKAKGQALKGSITSIKAQSAALKNATHILRVKNARKWQAGKKPVGFSGDGQRQYLTGLKLGAERTLILIDSSASMLDETIVNIIRRKLMDPATRRSAPKWQRTLRTLHWIIANLRPGKKFQVYQFNTRAETLLPGTDGRWISTDNSTQLSAALSAARQIAPAAGTSLHLAFDVIKKFRSSPDSVILLTDGLPTQGNIASKKKLVSSEERVEFFVQAIRRIPSGTPINTILFPMEGDPVAAGAFWQLAVKTKGSFIAPSRDWPQ